MLKFQYFGHQCEEPTHWKKTRCWERLRTGREVGDRGRDGWMVSLTQWTWVWGHSGSWWRTGKPGVPQSMGSQRVGRNWATQQEQHGMTDVTHYNSYEEFCYQWGWRNGSKAKLGDNKANCYVDENDSAKRGKLSMLEKEGHKAKSLSKWKKRSSSTRGRAGAW